MIDAWQANLEGFWEAVDPQGKTEMEREGLSPVVSGTGTHVHNTCLVRGHELAESCCIVDAGERRR